MPQATYSFGDDRLAGGADLMAVLHPAGINHRTAGTQFAAQGLGKGLDDRHILFLANTSAGSDDDFGLCQINIFRFGRFIADKFQSAAAVSGELSDLRRPARLQHRKGPGLDGQHCLCCGRL